MKNQLLNLKMIALMCLMMVLGGANVWAEEEVISLAKGSYANAQITWTGNSCSIIQSKGNTSLGVNGSYIGEPRWYKNHVVSFNANKGYKIDGASITCTTNDYASALKNSTYTNAKATYKGKVVTITASGDFTVTLGAQSRISKITIKYSKDIPTTPTLSISDNSLDFGANECNTNIAKKFTLSGVCLTASANLTLAGTNPEMFYVSPTSIAQTDGTIAETEVTVSYNPIAVGSHTATLTISSIGAEAKTITLTGTSANAYTVAWNVNGVAYTDGTPTTKVFEGKKVTTLPTTPKDINGKVFVGWTGASLSATQDVAPSVLFTNAADAPKVTGDVTYYAVFANKIGDGEVTYTKLTSDKFKTNAIYVIGADGRDGSTDYFYDYDGVDRRCWGRMTADISTKTPIYFKLSGTADNLIALDNGNNYLKPLSSSFMMSAKKSTIKLNSDGIINDGNGLTLRYNNSGGYGLRWYPSSSGISIYAYFYEVSGGYTYSGYCTTVGAAVEPTYTAQPLTLKAKDATGYYYATFSNEKVVFMPATVIPMAVEVDATGKINEKDIFARTKVAIGVESVEGYYIPAKTGVLLWTDKTSVEYYTVDNYAVDALAADVNMLKPSVTAGAFEAETDYMYYKLAYGDWTSKTGLGFYWGADNGGAFYVKAGTAYLAVPEANTTGAKGFTLSGEATGIEGVNANVENAKTIYNLNGQRVASMAKPGLYIVNGKKMIVRK